MIITNEAMAVLKDLDNISDATERYLDSDNKFPISILDQIRVQVFLDEFDGDSLNDAFDDDINLVIVPADDNVDIVINENISIKVKNPSTSKDIVIDVDALVESCDLDAAIISASMNICNILEDIMKEQNADIEETDEEQLVGIPTIDNNIIYDDIDRPDRFDGELTEKDGPALLAKIKKDQKVHVPNYDSNETETASDDIDDTFETYDEPEDILHFEGVEKKSSTSNIKPAMNGASIFKNIKVVDTVEDDTDDTTLGSLIPGMAPRKAITTPTPSTPTFAQEDDEEENIDVGKVINVQPLKDINNTSAQDTTSKQIHRDPMDNDAERILRQAESRVVHTDKHEVTGHVLTLEEKKNIVIKSDNPFANGIASEPVAPQKQR